MKKTAIIFSILASAFAHAKPLKVCDAKELKTLLATQKQWATEEGYTESRLLKNKKAQTVGFYSWSPEGGDIYSEICDYISSGELTVSSEWYYWQNDDYTSNPATWKVGVTYELAQDEGIATMKLLKANRDANVEVEFSVLGWDGEGENKVVRKEKLFFSK